MRLDEQSNLVQSNRLMKRYLAITLHRFAFWLTAEVLDELPELRTDFINSLVPVVERVYPKDRGLRPQTIAHHLKRYWFATRVQGSQGYALDFACGSGYGTEILREAGYIARGVDIDDEAVAYAKKNFPQCSFGRMPLERKYDLITFFEAIEHLDTVTGIAVINNLKRKLNPTGKLVASIPRDRNEKRNGFHKSHWNKNGLAIYLKSKFEDVKVYGQDWNTGEIGNVDPDFYIYVCSLPK